MRTILFYLSPFVLLPLCILICGGLAPFLGKGLVVRILLYGLLMLSSFCLAHFSRPGRTVDWAFALLCPLALLVFYFLLAFLEKGETYARFDLLHALRIVCQPPLLLAYVLTAISALCGSAVRKRKP